MTLWFCEVPMSQGCDAGHGYGDSRWCFRRRRYSVERWIPKERGPTEAPGQTGRPPRPPRPRSATGPNNDSRHLFCAVAECTVSGTSFPIACYHSDVRLEVMAHTISRVHQSQKRAEWDCYRGTDIPLTDSTSPHKFFEDDLLSKSH